MCLESAISCRLANCFKVSPRGDAQSLERGQEREGLSPVSYQYDSTCKYTRECTHLHPPRHANIFYLQIILNALTSFQKKNALSEAGERWGVSRKKVT